ncbi:MAG TPA: prepilin-type N-terminal cleavage/methylation domain-containing protein [Pirellulaceae bacterium]|nr:prepilin-type N-terminal cleavage/methylation domain-containing protein [Pirellulaceae bacterium]
MIPKLDRAARSDQIRFGAGHSGFTLLELLLAISAIAVLSTMALVIMRGVQDDARASRTRTIIQRCQAILQSRLESYETRMMPFRAGQVEPGANLAQHRHLRSRTLVEWLRAEMPCYQRYLWYYPSWESQSEFLGVPSTHPQFWPNGDPAMGLDWVNRYEALMQARIPAAVIANRLTLGLPADGLPGDSPGNPPPNNNDPYNPAHWLPTYHRNNQIYAALDNSPNSVEWENTLWEGAECLYAILHNTWYNGQRGTAFLSQNEIGRRTTTSPPAVLDAWGRPLYFMVRRNLDVDRNGDGVIDNADRDVNGDGVVDHLDTILDPRISITLDEVIIEVFSTRSWEF